MVKTKKLKYPCCKKEADFAEIMETLTEHAHIAATCPTMDCPECGKRIIVYLDIYSIEVEEED